MDTLVIDGKVLAYDVIAALRDCHIKRAIQMFNQIKPFLSRELRSEWLSNKAPSPLFSTLQEAVTVLENLPNDDKHGNLAQIRETEVFKRIKEHFDKVKNNHHHQVCMCWYYCDQDAIVT